MKSIVCHVLLTAVISAFALSICGCGGGDVETVRMRAQESLEQAIDLLDQREDAEAYKLLRRAARLAPEDPSIQTNLGIAAWRTGRYRVAVKAFRRAADNTAHFSPPEIRPLELLSDLYMHMREYSMARDTLDEAYQRIPHSPRVLCRIAALEISTGQAAMAEPLLREALARDPAYLPALYNLGILLRDRLNRHEEGVTVLQRYVEQAGDTPRARRVAGKLAEDDDKTHHLPTHEQLPEDSINQLIGARQAIIDSDIDQAVVLFRNVIKAHPQHPDPLWELYIIYERLIQDARRAEGLKKIFTREFGNDPRTGMSSHQLETAVQQEFTRAMDFHREGRLVEAITAYDRVLRLNPANAEAAYNMGLALRSQQQYAAAVAAFNRALMWQRDRPDTYYMLALALREAQQQEEAVNALNTALEINPDYARAHYLIGLIKSDSGDKTATRRHFQRFLDLAPQDPAAQNVAAWLRDNP